MNGHEVLAGDEHLHLLQQLLGVGRGEVVSAVEDKEDVVAVLVELGSLSEVQSVLERERVKAEELVQLLDLLVAWRCEVEPEEMIASKVVLDGGLVDGVEAGYDEREPRLSGAVWVLRLGLADGHGVVLRPTSPPSCPRALVGWLCAPSAGVPVFVQKCFTSLSRCVPPVDIGNMDPHRAGSGEAGASARRELERRRAAMHASRPTGLAGAVAFFVGPSATQRRQAREVKSWDTGARGEQMLAKHLSARCAEVPVLHDRRMPGSRANIDHIAVAASGVYVIDAKRYKGKIRIARRLFRAPRLMIAGRDRTKLIEGLSKQVAVVESIVAEVAPGVPVHGCLCFLNPDGFMAESGLPVLRTLEIGGYRLLSPRRLAKRLNGAGSLTRDGALLVHTRLAERLRAA